MIMTIILYIYIYIYICVCVYIVFDHDHVGTMHGVVILCVLFTYRKIIIIPTFFSIHEYFIILIIYIRN